MAFTLKHQKVHWEVDLDARALSGRAELQIEVTESLAELRLNCRQCKVRPTVRCQTSVGVLRCG
jgi:hypothetical protein